MVSTDWSRNVPGAKFWRKRTEGGGQQVSTCSRAWLLNEMSAAGRAGAGC